ncbi:DUF4340 domain-containing protein [Marinihelvus fidelis]|uniref:DUF4340 domain-containing protein n=1 Tax=Marinihelvus fidelis TaxID=2613842 RepID=A0A5N0T472_9GAMM|nr:DUF4340 domain-containing protein [Marinihelvus fidelis]KAA9129865.1 DUF4340 domain-containing protein [Marinihelvus fidelis]
MSTKTLVGLAIALAVVAGAVALLSSGDRGGNAGGAEGAVLPALAARVNDTQSLRVTVAGDETVASLARQGDRWTIAELQGYPADWARVRDTLAGLAQATVIEPKTDNPDYYDRLGVEDVDGEDAAGVLLTLAFADGEPLGVIVGNAAAGREGRYLRPLGQVASVLADFDVDVPRTPIGWADTAVIDLAAAEVADVRVTPAGGETLRVWKTSADDTDFILEGGLPEGRELKSTWAMNSLGGALAGLVFEDVRPQDGFDWEGATQVRALTFSGLQVNLDLVREDDGAWVRVAASAPFETQVGDEPAADDDPAEPADVVTADEAAARIRERTDGWAYRISSFKADALDQQLDDLLKPLAEAENDNGQP